MKNLQLMDTGQRTLGRGAVKWCLAPFFICLLISWGVVEVLRGSVTPFVVNESRHSKVALLSLSVDGESLNFSLPTLRNHRTVFFDHWPSFENNQKLHVIEIVVQPETGSAEKHTCTVKSGGIFTWGQIQISYKNNEIACWFIPNDEFIG